MKISKIVKVILLIIISSCANKNEIVGGNFSFIKTNSGIKIITNGQEYGELTFADSSIVFQPNGSKLKKIKLSRQGIESINQYNNNNDLNGLTISFFDNEPSKVEWYNQGNLYSTISSVKAGHGFVESSNLSYIDTNMIFTPQVFIFKDEEASNKYRFIVYSKSYPIYLMSITYNLEDVSEGEYDFFSNSFFLPFDKTNLTSPDTLKLVFRYFANIDSARSLIKTYSHNEKLY